MARHSSCLTAALFVAALIVTTCQAVDRHKKHHDDDTCPACGGPDEAPSPGTFDFYFLVRQWGPEYCHDGSCTVQPSTKQFTLHGLWPNLDNSCPEDYPEHCSDEAFSFDNIPQPLQKRMGVDWPSYKNSDFCFYTHEWDCHGTCSGLTQSQYFSKVISLHEEYSIMDALSASNIAPSNTPIQTSAVLAALKSGLGGFEPILHCSKGGGNDYLEEVYMCVSKDLVNGEFMMVNCADVCVNHPCNTTKSSCGDELIFKVPGNIDTVPADANEECKCCKPKSGTCKPHGHQGPAQCPTNDPNMMLQSTA